MSDEVRAEIFAKLVRSFPCAARFESHVKSLLGLYVGSAHCLNRHTMEVVLKSVRHNYKKDQWVDSKVMFKALFVYIVIQNAPLLHSDYAVNFRERYPEFNQIDDAIEQASLLHFRKTLLIAVLILDPSKAKNDLVILVGRICGGVYIPGCGQTEETKRRVLIYERETGVKLRKRADSHAESTTSEKSLSTPLKMVAPITPVLAAHSPPKVVPQPVVNEIDSAEDTDASTERARQLAHRERILQGHKRSAREFWLQHVQRMEGDDDVPCVYVPREQAHAAYAYPSHDWGMPRRRIRMAPPEPPTPQLHLPLNKLVYSAAGPHAAPTNWVYPAPPVSFQRVFNIHSVHDPHALAHPRMYAPRFTPQTAPNMK